MGGIYRMMTTAPSGNPTSNADYPVLSAGRSFRVGDETMRTRSRCARLTRNGEEAGPHREQANHRWLTEPRPWPPCEAVKADRTSLPSASQIDGRHVGMPSECPEESVDASMRPMRMVQKEPNE